MKLLSDYEEYLIYAKIAGSLEQEEEPLCAELLHTNDIARETYQRLLLKLPVEDVATSFDRLKDSAQWQDLTVPATIRKMVIFKWLTAAAAAILMIIAGIWWLQRPKNTPHPSSKNIQLTLANGQQINLSQEKGNISGRQALLQNSGTTLRYKVAAAGTEGLNHLTVPTGMSYQITLADSTKIWLNAATRLDFPFAFTGNTREVTITGEAYLEVASMTNKPFIVHLPNSKVLVLGTRFNVNSYEQDQVSLVDGAVRIQAGGQQVDLKPGEVAVIQKDAGISTTTFDVKKVLAWREGLFYFRNATVDEISHVMPRWYGIETLVDNPNLPSRRFTGVVDRNQPISIFQDNLKAISGIDSYVDEKNVLHFK